MVKSIHNINTSNLKCTSRVTLLMLHSVNITCKLRWLTWTNSRGRSMIYKNVFHSQLASAGGDGSRGIHNAFGAVNHLEHCQLKSNISSTCIGPASTRNMCNAWRTEHLFSVEC